MARSLVPAVMAAVALALGGVAVTAGAGEAAKPTVSAASAKTIKAAKDACDAKKFSECVAKANEALGNAKKTPFDTFVSYQLLAYAHAQTNNAAEVLKALQGQLDSGQLGPAEQNKTIKTMAGIAYQQKNYAACADYGNRLIRAGAADADTYTLVAQSYYLQNKFADTAKFLDGYVDDLERRGAVPKEQSLLLLRSAYEKMDNAEGAAATLERLVVHYPKADYWDNLLYKLRRDPKLTERQTMHVYRLMQETKTLKQPSDFAEMADVASSSGIPGEAQRVLQSGIESNVFTKPEDKARAERLMGSAKKASDADKAGLTKLEAEAAKTKTGELDYALGTSLFGHGDYAKAVAALTKGIEKGGLKNPTDAQLVLGVAQVRAGAKADAVKTFRGIKTEDPLTQRIAKLWTLYAQ